MEKFCMNLDLTTSNEDWIHVASLVFKYLSSLPRDMHMSVSVLQSQWKLKRLTKPGKRCFTVDHLDSRWVAWAWSAALVYKTWNIWKFIFYRLLGRYTKFCTNETFLLCSVQPMVLVDVDHCYKYVILGLQYNDSLTSWKFESNVYLIEEPSGLLMLERRLSLL